MRKTLTAMLLAVAFVAVAMPAQATESRSLGRTLTKAERQEYRCGALRGRLPVRAFIVHRKAYRLVPKRMHPARFAYRCGYATPHVAPAPKPAPAPTPATPPAPAAPVAAVQETPVPTQTPLPPTSCRYEIGDPRRAPVVSGLAPANRMDVWDPSPEVRQATMDPMVYWNQAPNSVSDDGHLLVTFSDGKQYLHPVGSFNFAFAALRQYRITDDPTWLARALNSANDVYATMTPGGLIPQDFPWPGPVGQLMTKPAYSALTQGQALSLAARLYWLTNDTKWRDLADKEFATLATPGTAAPAVTFVDTDGYLWFEEFPMECPSRVWNGHVFATFAMADYYWLTGNQRALQLFDAGATTALHYMPQIRVPTGFVYYNISHRHQVDAWYHRMMTNQLRDLATITGAQTFTDWADLLAADFS